MNFELNTTQCLLRDTLDSFLAKQYRFDARRKAVLGEPGWQPLLWRRFANELGLLGAGLPAPGGGSGGWAVEQMQVMEAVGSALHVAPDPVSLVSALMLFGTLSARARTSLDQANAH